MIAAWPDKVTVACLVDNRLVQDHDYDIEVLLPRSQPKLKSATFKGRVVGGKRDFVISDPKSVNWSAVKVIYMGPLDPRTVRQELIVDDALK